MQHGIVATAITLADVPGYVKLLMLLAALLSAVCARPRGCPRLHMAADGSWAVPEAAPGDLRILPGTQFTQWWALLHLGHADGRRLRLRVWRDAFAPQDWRRISIVLHEHRCDSR